MDKGGRGGQRGVVGRKKKKKTDGMEGGGGSKHPHPHTPFDRPPSHRIASHRIARGGEGWRRERGLVVGSGSGVVGWGKGGSLWPPPTPPQPTLPDTLDLKKKKKKTLKN